MSTHETHGTGVDHDDFVEMVREIRRFVREQVVPLEAQIDETDEVPERIREQAKELGLYGFAIPVEHGGIGLSMSQEVELAFELGWTTPAFRSMFGTNNGIAGQVIMLSGTDEQKADLLPKLASGELTAAFALTEPEAGSSPADLTTTATKDGDEWVLDGTKRYITNAPVAEVFMVFARSSKAERPIDGISAFVVPKDTPGLTVAPRDHKMGQLGAWTADVMFNDVRVGPEALVGGVEGRGYRTALACLAHGRLHIGALCVGLAGRLVEESVQWAADRRQGGKRIAEYQLVGAMLADSQTEYMAGRALVRETARAFDDGSDTRLGPACAKLYASEMVGRVADRAVQVHGGAGYIRGVPVERFYRDVRLFRIYEGTSQIQQLVIAAELRPGPLTQAAGALGGVVTALATTPVKGLRLHARSEVRLGPVGADGNRTFFLIDDKAKLVNGKRVGPLTAVIADYDAEAGQLALQFPDGSTVADEVQLGAEVETKFFSRRPIAQLVSGPFSQALSEYAGLGLRLVRADPSLTAVDRGPNGAVSLISEASVEHLSGVAGEDVDPRRFRMLIQVSGPGPHREDELVGGRARIGDALVAFHGHVGRCLVTGQNPDTGVKNMPTLELLRYRRGLGTTEPLAFGIYGGVIEPGVVRLGDELRAPD